MQELPDYKSSWLSKNWMYPSDNWLGNVEQNRVAGSRWLFESLSQIFQHEQLI